MKVCRLCPRVAVDESTLLCKYHELSLENVKKAYPSWSRAYGNISWGEYLKMMIDVPETGEWAKEVARSELEILGVVDGNKEKD